MGLIGSLSNHFGNSDRVCIAAQGLAAATAAIAKQAGVSNGSLFVYFDTKATLLSELYVALKTEMGAVTADALPLQRGAASDVRLSAGTRLHFARPDDNPACGRTTGRSTPALV